MTKPTALQGVFNTLTENEAARSPDHYLFFLGSETAFTEKPTVGERWYERGETLSYAAQAIVSLLGEKDAAEVRPKGEPLSYCSPSVDVLNGPTTRGAEVGTRIAQGIFLALRAIASGKRTLQIAAHSRGAVEAILVLHELDRIKKTLITTTPLKTLRQILLESTSKPTADAMALFFPKDVEEDTLENRAELFRRLDVLKINPFLIDPVPGDTVWGIPGFTWHDPLFYEKPACDDYELLICRDERSGGFYPIVPKDMQHNIIPGHHGSSLGNRYSQLGDDLHASVKHFDTTGIQDLVLFKLFYFFNKTTGTFGQRSQELAPLDLAHPALDKVVNTFLATTEPQRKRVMLDLYFNVLLNDKAYHSFTSTTYSRFLGTTTDRCIHYQAPDYKGLSTLLTEMHGQFVNIEHAMVYLNDYVDFSGTQLADPEVQVTAINLTLANIIAEMRKDSAENERSKLLAIIKNEEGRKTLLNSLSVMVYSIGQKYLHNHLSVAEKIRLGIVLEQPFATLRSALNDPDLYDDISIIEHCQSVLQDGIKDTIETHYQATRQQIDHVFQQAELFLVDNERFVLAFNEFLHELTIEEDELNVFLVDMKLRLSAVTPININTVQQAILLELEQTEKNNALDSIQKEKLTGLFFGKQSIRLKAYFEAHQLSIEQYLSKIEQLYDAISELMYVYPQLSLLVGEKKLATACEELSFQRLSLIKLASHLLQEKKHEININPAKVNKIFSRFAKNEVMLLPLSTTEDKTVESIAETLAADATRVIFAATDVGLFAKSSHSGLSRAMCDVDKKALDEQAEYPPSQST